MFTAGIDYEEGPYSVTIPKGVPSAYYCIGIINDTQLEEDETISIEIKNDTLHPDVVLMDPAKATVTILDDECKCNNCTC